MKDPHLKGQSRHVGHRRFNEMFMLHSSTSPFYPLFASLDVGAQMMKGRSGEVLWEDTIRLGIEMRKKVPSTGPTMYPESETTSAAVVLGPTHSCQIRSTARWFPMTLGRYSDQ